MHHGTVIRLRRQLRIHVLHRHWLTRHARPGCRPHRRQVRRRSCWHHPVLRPHFARPQLIDHRVIHLSRTRSHIRHQRYAQRPIRTQRRSRRAPSHRRSACGQKRRPRNDQASLRSAPVRQINCIRDRGRRRSTLRGRRRSRSRQPKPGNHRHGHPPIKKPPTRAATRVKHRLLHPPSLGRIRPGPLLRTQLELLNF